MIYLKFEELPDWQRDVLNLVKVNKFRGHLYLWNQIISSTYKILDNNGSLEIHVNNGSSTKLLNSVPFEFESIDCDNIPIHCLMHTSNGIIYYFQVFKENDEKIINFPSLKNTRLIINKITPRP